MVLDNSQSVQPRALEKGQMTVFEDPSPPTIHPDEEHATVRAELIDLETIQHMYSDKRIQFDLGKGKFCAESTLWGFEEDVDDPQPERAQSDIFTTQTRSKPNDCYRNVTAEKLVNFQRCPAASHKEAEIMVPETKYCEGVLRENVFIHLESDPTLDRCTTDSPIKVSRESLDAYNICKNYDSLFSSYCRVTLNHVWKNTNLEWGKISDPSKHLLSEIMPKCSYRIDYNKGPPDSLNHKKKFIEQSATDTSSNSLETRSLNAEFGNASDTVNSSIETACIESITLNPVSTINLNVPPIDTCLSFSSNVSSDFFEINKGGKQTFLPMPVPQTSNFETDTVKQEICNINLGSAKAKFDTHLPLKKRKLTPYVMIPESKSNAATQSSQDKIEFDEYSYPATPMLSIADVYIPKASTPFKTPGEKKQLPVDPPSVPIRYDPPNHITPFTYSMNTFSSTVYRLNECPYNMKLDCPSYCLEPTVIFPPESLSGS